MPRQTDPVGFGGQTRRARISKPGYEPCRATTFASWRNHRGQWRDATSIRWLMLVLFFCGGICSNKKGPRLHLSRSMYGLKVLFQIILVCQIAGLPGITKSKTDPGAMRSRCFSVSVFFRPPAVSVGPRHDVHVRQMTHVVTIFLPGGVSLLGWFLWMDPSHVRPWT